MTYPIQHIPAGNGPQWLPDEAEESVAQRQTFQNVHNRFLTMYGPDFMLQVYRLTFGQLQPQLPAAERNKLSAAFRVALAQTLAEQST